MSRSAWQPVLDAIETSLAEWLSRATLPEPNLIHDSSISNPPAPPMACLEQVEACLRQAAEEAGATDALLAEAAAALEGWRERAASLAISLRPRPTPLNSAPDRSDA